MITVFKFKTTPFYKYLDLVFVFISIALCVYVRLRFINIPFDRDEGEYAYAGQQILKGIAPYKEVYNMKFPGVYFMYALFFSIFGKSVLSIRLGGMLMNLISGFFLFKIAKIYYKVRTACYALSAFLLLSLMFSGQGIMTNAEVFVIMFGLGGIYFILENIKMGKNTLLLSGIFLSLSCIMKQTGALYAFLGGLLFLQYYLRNWKLKPFLQFITGALLPFTILLIYLSVNGVLDRCYFFTFQYAKEYATIVSSKVGWYLFKTNFSAIFESAKYFFLAALLAIPASVIYFKKPGTGFLLLFVLISIIMVCPGYYFRVHYFLYLYPAAALCFGVACCYIWNTGHNRLLSFLPVLVFGIVLFQYCNHADTMNYFFRSNSEEVSRQMSNYAIFTDAEKIGEKIKSISQPDDQIGIIGNEPEIFYYAERKSATGYIYTYPLLENQKYADSMTNEYISEIEQNKPEIFLHMDISNSGDNKKNIDRIAQWWEKYKANYDLACIFCSHGPVDPYVLVPMENESTCDPSLTVEIFKRKHELVGK